MGQVVCPSWISPTYGALGEMSFQYVASRKVVLAKTTSIGPSASIYMPSMRSFSSKRLRTYVEEGDASSASHGDTACCSGHMAICRRQDLSLTQW